MKQTSPLISLHGGHSGEFCCHARNSLEEIVQAYIRRGFSAVGITEHMPPPQDRFRYPDEVARGLTAANLRSRFDRYFEELDRLKDKYRDQIRIFRGFETETVTGWQDQVFSLMETFRPDYVVGSVHHVADTCFDLSRQAWEDLVQRLGSVEALYLAYFDSQYEMIQTLHPFVVGHFDIIRLYDPDYVERFRVPRIREKVERNLALIKDLGLVLDFNLRPLSRGEAHPYLYPDILVRARDLGIPAVPGDDSHGSDQAGLFVPEAVAELSRLGFSTNWPSPGCRADTLPKDN